MTFSGGLWILILPLIVCCIDIWLWRIRLFPLQEEKRASREAGAEAVTVFYRLSSAVRLRRGVLMISWAVSLGWLILLTSFKVVFLWIDLYFLGVVVGLMLFDAKYYLLPDPAVYLLLWGGVLFALLDLSPQMLSEAIWGVMISYGVLLLIKLLGWLYYRQEVMGQGDLKFSAAIGAWIGGGNIDYFLLIASLTGVIWGSLFFFKVSQNRKSVIPFGPSLGFSGIILYFMERFSDAL